MGSELPTTMRAWLFTSSTGKLEDRLYFSELTPAPPAPKAGQILVKVRAAALNPADYKLAETPIAGRLVYRKPAVPAMDYSGDVVAVGPGIDSVKVGDFVYGRSPPPGLQFGALGEYMLGYKGAFALVPAGVSAVEAAAVTTAALSAYQAIVPYVKKGDAVFINGGSGGVGTYGIQIAKALGCSVSATSSAANGALVKELGAEHIDYRSQNVPDVLAKDGQRFALAADFVGTSALYLASDRYLKPDGRYVNIAAQSTVSSALDLASNLFRPAFLGGGKRPYSMVGAKDTDAAYENLSRWMAEGKVKSVIDEEFKFKDAPAAFTRLRTGRARGKVVINHET